MFWLSSLAVTKQNITMLTREQLSEINCWIKLYAINLFSRTEIRSESLEWHWNLKYVPEAEKINYNNPFHAELDITQNVNKQTWESNKTQKNDNFLEPGLSVSGKFSPRLSLCCLSSQQHE